MNTKLPANFLEEFYSRTLPFVRYSVGSDDEVDYLGRLMSIDVAITGSKQILNTLNGQHMLFLTANLLSRLCLSLNIILPSENKIDVKFPFVKGSDISSCLKSFCKSINPCLKINEKYDRKRFDIVIVIGDCDNDFGRTIHINSDGWIAYIGTEGNSFPWVSNNPNPVGAQAAACIGVGEAFKAIYAPLRSTNSHRTKAGGSMVFSTFDYGFNRRSMMNPRLPNHISLGEVHMVSMGAINNAVLYSLCAMPNIEGELLIIEPQRVDISNLNRYILTTAKDALLKRRKVDVAKEFANAHLNVASVYEMKYSDFRKLCNQEIDLAIVGVDNNESRWEIQNDWPKVLLCGGTGMSNIQVSRHNSSGGACLGCLYPQNTLGDGSQITPTASFVSALSGVLLSAEIIKEKVDNFSGFCISNTLNIDSLNSSYHTVRYMEKSQYCACNCSNAIRKSQSLEEKSA